MFVFSLKVLRGMLLNTQSTCGSLQCGRVPSYSAAQRELIPVSLGDAATAGTARAVKLKFCTICLIHVLHVFTLVGL